jgi:uncharacterized LabA/DUF88 family protein
MSISSPSYPPQAFQKAMVFVDGTNLLFRLASARLKVPSLQAIFPNYVRRRQIARTYFYSVAQQLAKAKRDHGEAFLDGVRVVLGEGVVLNDGNIKEKGVDALLVADLIYHAASRNCEYALVVTVDTDFVYALRRAEDFGCRTAVMAVGVAAPTRLREACDDCFELSIDEMLRNKWASL